MSGPPDTSFKPDSNRRAPGVGSVHAPRRFDRMQAAMPRGLVRAVVVVSVIVALIVLLNLPAPGSHPELIRGTVVRSDLVQGSKGARGFFVVRLDDGSEVSMTTSSSKLPPLHSTVTVEEEYGIFGQRLVARH